MNINSRLASMTAVVSVSALVLSGCGAGNDPLDGQGSDSEKNSDRDRGTIVIGTANFPESELIGQLWAEALRTQSIDVEVKSGIGSREVYIKAIEEGSIDLVPEYSGNLAMYLAGDEDAVTVGMSSEEVLDALKEVTPKNLAVGEAAEAQSKDSYRVTPEVAQEYDLKSLEDLRSVPEIIVAGNPELAERPYGPKGLSEFYGVEESSMEFKAISDGGGPLTVKALTDGAATIADIYTTSPVLNSEGEEINLVMLDDPKGMILPQNIVPLMAKGRLGREARETIAWVNRTLTTEKLTELNKRNVGPDKEDPAKIAREYTQEVF
ncbi:ABC transporter substrate-binding protein [Corynebacterium sp. TAE3-ERU2]|uniref:ABC transporter substrate-binding protein n=1 Tax=Corynebacterium sp. TAE3-ERU2 TaxID=2849497 RepID=UPI002101FBDA|nr:ABC transporter substrate-binding protein [Corynebacterium sp. TAE3-ERU2]